MANELIQVILNDRSSTVSTFVGATGATVIKSTRGSNEPVYFSAKQTKRILDYFGIPDTGNEQVQEVLDYNSKYPIFVSAPSTGGKYGGVLVTKTGTEPFIGGKTTNSLDFSNIPNVQQSEVIPNGIITNFTGTIADTIHYVPRSVDILLNGVSINVTGSNAEPSILTTLPDVGSGTYTAATGAVSFTFTSAPSSSDTVEIAFKTNYSSDAYFAVFNKNPQADDLAIKVEKNNDNDFVLYLQKKDWNSSSYTAISSFPQTGSTVVNKQNGYGQNIYMPELFKNSDYISVVANTATVTTFTDDTDYVPFTGGLRGTTALAQYTAGWEYFKNTQKYPADIYFDTTTDAGIPAIFNTLRSSYAKYSSFILPLPNVSAADAITASASRMTDNRGIAFYWGWGKVNNTYTGGTIASNLMGRVALRYADMYDAFNGLAPAWYNENGTHGGQLGSGILEMFFDADETQQQALSVARINPIVMHPTFGVVITRERTSQSLQSDYSSIGHSRLADYYIKNIINQVLPYQLYKLNDHNHRTIVKSSIERIIGPTLAQPYNLLREYIVVCDETNNDNDVLAREEFVVTVGIKFTPFGKMIKLFFINADQGVSVKEVV